MTTREAVSFARAYADMGSAVQDQLDDLLRRRFDDLNPNAVQEIEQRLSGYCDDGNGDDDIALACQDFAEWLAANKDDDDEDED
jgi:hypothetical protein